MSVLSFRHALGSLRGLMWELCGNADGLAYSGGVSLLGIWPFPQN